MLNSPYHRVRGDYPSKGSTSWTSDALLVSAELNESRAFMNMARHTTTSAHQRRRLLLVDAVGAVRVVIGAPGASLIHAARGVTLQG